MSLHDHVTCTGREDVGASLQSKDADQWNSRYPRTHPTGGDLQEESDPHRSVVSVMCYSSGLETK